MIVAGLLLLSVGLADLLRPIPRAAVRWSSLAAVAVVVLTIGVASGAPLAALVALACAAAWVWLVPVRGRAPAGFLPAVGLALICAVSVIIVGPRAHAGLLGELWRVRSPTGELSLDQTVLVAGVMVFLIESANAVVRVALAGEGVAVLRPEAVGDEVSPDRALKGGRLIGPLERLIVFALTLAAAYPLLAAFIAAKGIVRFPEISRDSDSGNRAEYFLIGSLVSWVLALAAAFLVWWALTAA